MSDTTSIRMKEESLTSKANRLRNKIQVIDTNHKSFSTFQKVSTDSSIIQTHIKQDVNFLPIPVYTSEISTKSDDTFEPEEGFKKFNKNKLVRLLSNHQKISEWRNRDRQSRWSSHSKAASLNDESDFQIKNRKSNADKLDIIASTKSSSSFTPFSSSSSSPRAVSDIQNISSILLTAPPKSISLLEADVNNSKTFTTTTHDRNEPNRMDSKISLTAKAIRIREKHNQIQYQQQISKHKRSRSISSTSSKSLPTHRGEDTLKEIANLYQRYLHHTTTPLHSSTSIEPIETSYSENRGYDKTDTIHNEEVKDDNESNFENEIDMEDECEQNRIYRLFLHHITQINPSKIQNYNTTKLHTNHSESTDFAADLSRETGYNHDAHCNQSDYQFISLNREDATTTNNGHDYLKQLGTLVRSTTKIVKILPPIRSTPETIFLHDESSITKRNRFDAMDLNFEEETATSSISIDLDYLSTNSSNNHHRDDDKGYRWKKGSCCNSNLMSLIIYSIFIPTCILSLSLICICQYYDIQSITDVQVIIINLYLYAKDRFDGGMEDIVQRLSALFQQMKLDFVNLYLKWSESFIEFIKMINIHMKNLRDVSKQPYHGSVIKIQEVSSYVSNLVNMMYTQTHDTIREVNITLCDWMKFAQNYFIHSIYTYSFSLHQIEIWNQFPPWQIQNVFEKSTAFLKFTNLEDSKAYYNDMIGSYNYFITTDEVQVVSLENSKHNDWSSTLWIFKNSTVQEIFPDLDSAILKSNSPQLPIVTSQSIKKVDDQQISFKKSFVKDVTDPVRNKIYERKCMQHSWIDANSRSEHADSIEQILMSNDDDPKSKRVSFQDHVIDPIRRKHSQIVCPLHDHIDHVDHSHISSSFWKNKNMSTPFLFSKTRSSRLNESDNVIQTTMKIPKYLISAKSEIQLEKVDELKNELDVMNLDDDFLDIPIMDTVSKFLDDVRRNWKEQKLRKNNKKLR